MSWIACVLCAGVVWVIAFDAIGAYLARRIGFRYANLAVVQFAAYVAAGYVAGLHADPLAAGVVGAVMGLVESTIGWAISWQIGPGRAGTITVGRVVRVSILLTLLAACFATVGAMASETRSTLPLSHQGAGDR